MKKLDKHKLKTFEVEGRMEWTGVYTVVAHTPEEATESVKKGLWEDWSPLNLSDWEATSAPKVMQEWD